MIKFTKAHAYGNDFIYVRRDAVEGVRPGEAGAPGTFAALARELCDRHAGIGGDGLILFEPTSDGASMLLFNADGSRAEVSGNGVRALGAILLRNGQASDGESVTIHTDAGSKRVTRTARTLPADTKGVRETFRSAMGLPRDLRQTAITAGGEKLGIAVMDFGNPQAVLLGPLPDRERFTRLGSSVEHHRMFPAGTNIEFAEVESPQVVRILIWERGVGPTSSSGTGSCAALVAAAAFGGASRQADVVAPGGAQRVEWLDDSVYLTGWAEVLFDGEWLRQA
jgi:diaminopimelate epimerase